MCRVLNRDEKFWVIFHSKVSSFRPWVKDLTVIGKKEETEPGDKYAVPPQVISKTTFWLSCWSTCPYPQVEYNHLSSVI